MSRTVSAAAYESLMQFLYRAPIGLVQTTMDGEVEMINPTSARLLMLLSINGSLDNLLDVMERLAPQLRSQVQAAQHEGDVICDALRFTPPATNGMPARTLSISVVRLDGGRLMAILDDVSQQVLQEQNLLERRLRVAALTDALTKMPNRAALSAPIANALLQRGREDGSQFAVLFLNCDRFKRVNDLFGATVGDRLLSVLAARRRIDGGQSRWRRVRGPARIACQQRGSTCDQSARDRHSGPALSCRWTFANLRRERRLTARRWRRRRLRNHDARRQHCDGRGQAPWWWTISLAAQNGGVQAVLHQLKALGVALALDDFGTGYSSLASLHQFPVDVVKIDRSFTSRVDISLHHRVLVQATVMVANSLGMSTVVEGLETDAQAAVVRQLGCDKGQGYLFNRPLETQALGSWLQLAPVPA
jgi:predicted signal transduction protein with EAL and GGDEF domain